MPETITLNGKPFNLKGELPKTNEQVPDCFLTNSDLEDLSLSSYKGKMLLIMTVPSLDTPICSKEAHRFNQELGRFINHVTPIAVSMDLPFAQKRWCAAEDVDYLITLSDYKRRDFGEKFGVFIPDLGLLARAIFILDPQMRVHYVELIKETTQEPDYEAILDKLSMRVL